MVIFSVIFSVFLWISFAISEILDSSYSDDTEYTALTNEHLAADDQISNNNQNVTRTVIPAVPKTGPSGNLIWIILATLAIFGGYIYIRKRADI